MIRMFIIALAVCVFAADGRAADPIEVTAGGTGFRNTRGEEKWLAYQRNVETASGGAVTMKMLIFGELGAEENLVAGIRRGRVQVANWSGAVATTVVPEMAVLYAPYLFDNYAEADFIMDNYLFAAYAKLLADKDVEFIAWDEIGFGEVWSTTPIILPQDAKGKRFRVSSNDAAQLFAQALEADVIPLAFTDIVSSLQTGLIEAGETGAVMYARSGIAEQAKHVTMTDHNFATSIIVLRKSWLERLPADRQTIMKESWIPMSTSRQWTREEVAADLAQAEQRGFTVHRLSKEQRDRWRDATAVVTRQLIDRIGGDAQRIYDIAMGGQEGLRGAGRRISASTGGFIMTRPYIATLAVLTALSAAISAALPAIRAAEAATSVVRRTTLLVSDVEASVAFYEKLGFTPWLKTGGERDPERATALPLNGKPRRSSFTIMAGRDPWIAMIGLLQYDKPDLARTREITDRIGVGDAVIMIETDDLDGVYRDLQAMNTPMLQPPQEAVTESADRIKRVKNMFFRDPDGWVIEMSQVLGSEPLVKQSE